MKKTFGVALLALPVLAASLHAEGWPLNIQASCSFCFKSSHGPRCPQAGPWYLYWPLEAHFVAPAPTGYPYWPPPQGLPNINFGGPTCPPGVPVPPPVASAPPVAAAPIPAVQTAPQPAPPSAPPAASPRRPSSVQLPPYLQPTSYYAPLASGQPPSYYAPLASGQPPSYWYDR